MANTRDELKSKIEALRQHLNDSIDRKEEYGQIYRISVELDELLNQYVVLEP